MKASLAVALSVLAVAQGAATYKDDRSDSMISAGDEKHVLRRLTDEPVTVKRGATVGEVAATSARGPAEYGRRRRKGQRDDRRGDWDSYHSKAADRGH
jgi:hypothetical protein